MDMHYLDHAATTPVLPEVREAMQPFLSEDFGNSSSVYALGRSAKKGIEEAREWIADAVHVEPSEIVFTGGGTEADNQALKGAALRHRGNGAHIVTVATEHHAVLHSAQWLETQGFDVTYLSVDQQGIIDLEELAAVLRKNTILVSVMHANNEVGTIQPIGEVVRITKEHSRALVHTDAVQALGKIPLDLDAFGVDLASFSAHKLGGPKGVGALYVRRRTAIDPLIHGGGQERDLRSGTSNVAGIVGFGVATSMASREITSEASRLEKMRDGLQKELSERISGVHVNGAGAQRLPGTLNVCIEGIEGESLLLMLDEAGIAASSGSACTSGSLEPSHVLVGMGVEKQLALGSLRVSLGRSSTQEDIDLLIDVLPGIVLRLRGVSSKMSATRS